MKKVFSLIMVTAVIVLLFVACSDSSKSKSSDYDSIYSDAYAEAYKQAYDEGYADAYKEYSGEYERGYQEALEEHYYPLANGVVDIFNMVDNGESRQDIEDFIDNLESMEYFWD